jgi:hypothetical protein
MLPFSLIAVAATAVAIVADSRVLMVALQLIGLAAFAFAVRKASLVGEKKPAPVANSRPKQSSPPPSATATAASGTEAAT